MRTFKDDLAELPIFSETSRAELAAIRRQLTPVQVPAGRVLVREGEWGDQFMVIADGEALVTQGGRPVATLGRGDLVGEMALLGVAGLQRRNATVTVTSDARVYAGSRSEFRQILGSAPSVARRIRQTAESRTLDRAA